MSTPHSAAGERALRRWLPRSPAALGGLVLVLACAACFLSLPWTIERMRTPNLDAALQAPWTDAPQAAHYSWWERVLGTDELGRSVAARTLYGGAISLTLGILAAAVAVVFGSIYGCVAGYLGGRCDAVMMRIVDVLYALPYMLLVMLLAVSLGAWLQSSRLIGAEGARFFVLVLAIGGVSWLSIARVVRGEVLSLRERAFVEAARCLGTPTHRIILRHLLPNVVGPITVFATLTVPQAILQESFLSFLGVGVQPPQATWGSLVADGIRGLNPIRFDWWLTAVPAVCLGATLLALNFIGDGLRDLFDARSGHSRETGTPAEVSHDPQGIRR